MISLMDKKSLKSHVKLVAMQKALQADVDEILANVESYKTKTLKPTLAGAKPLDNNGGGSTLILL